MQGGGGKLAASLLQQTVILVAIAIAIQPCLLTAGEAEPDTSSGNLVFTVETGGDDTYSSVVGSYPKLIKKGNGKLTIRASSASALGGFTGEIEVQEGTLAIPQLPNIGKPTKVTVSSGATLDATGCAADGYIKDAQVFLAGPGYNNQGAFMRSSGGATYDAFFKDVTLLGDTVVRISARTGLTGGTLNLNGYSLTKAAWSGDFPLAQGGSIIGTGDINLNVGGTILNAVDMTAGTSDNHCNLAGQMNWWFTSHSKPIPWSLVGTANPFTLYAGQANAGFTSARLWSGPISSGSGHSLALNGIAKSVMTFSGPVALGGGLSKDGAGSVRFTGSSFSANGTLTHSNGYLQFAPPSGSSASFAYSGSSGSSIYSSLLILAEGSTVVFGGRFYADVCTNGTILVRGGDCTIGNLFNFGGTNAKGCYVQSGGAKVCVTGNVSRIGTGAGCDASMTLTGEGTEFRCGAANGRQAIQYNRDVSGSIVLNVNSGATLAASRMLPYNSSVNSLDFYVNADGGVFKPLMAWGWNGQGAYAAVHSPTAFTVFEGGCTFDLSECYGNAFGTLSADGSTISFPLESPGAGLRIESVAIPAGHAILSERYDNVPPVRFDGGGTAATAYLDVDDETRLVKGIVVTGRGWGYAAAAKAYVQNSTGTAEYAFDATTASAPAAQSSDWRGLAVRGTVPLKLACANTYLGPTIVEGGGIEFLDQAGRPLGSGLALTNGTYVSFGNTDQSLRPIPFVRGAGRITDLKADTSITIGRLEVTAAQLVAGETLAVEGTAVLADGAELVVLDPENIAKDSLPRGACVMSANSLSVPASGVAIDDDLAKHWRVSVRGNSVWLKPETGFVLLFK